MKQMLSMCSLVLILAACWPDSKVEAATQPNANASKTKSSFDSQTDSKLDQCQEQYKNLKSSCDSKQHEVNQAKEELEQLKRELEDARKQLSATGVRDPTWEGLRSFVKQDKGNEKKYDIDRFNCQAFALELRDHARDRNIRGAYVILNYEGKNVGHAINAFETLDHGLVYIEPQSDEVAYVKIGSPFGTIPIDAVKRRYFTCPTGANGFAHPLQTEYFEGKLFEYEYYINYLQRSKCYDEGNRALDIAIDDYNQRVREYELKVAAYNRGRPSPSYQELNQIDKGLDILDKQLKVISSNLKLFEKDLGGQRSLPQDVVSKVKAHWN